MKKLMFVVAMVVIMGCSDNSSSDTKFQSVGSFKNFQRINDTLAYDPQTKIVYYYFRTGGGYAGYGFISPYISSNGNYCKYQNMSIIEVER